eukprot:2463779-Rhodomonas_salina.1
MQYPPGISDTQFQQELEEGSCSSSPFCDDVAPFELELCWACRMLRWKTPNISKVIMIRQSDRVGNAEGAVHMAGIARKRKGHSETTGRSS